MSTDSRPEYVHCIRATAIDVKRSKQACLCLRKADPSECLFEDINHAIAAVLYGSRLMVCPDCSKVIRDALDKGTWEPDGQRPATNPLVGGGLLAGS